MAEAHANRAGGYLKKGDFDRAIADSSAALALAPKLAIAHFTRTAALFRKGKIRESIRDYDEAIHCDPNLADAHVNRGVIYFRLGDQQKAAHDFTRAIELNPQLAPAYGYRGAVALGTDDFKQAIADCTRTIELDPSLAPAYWTARPRGTVAPGMPSRRRRIRARHWSWTRRWAGHEILQTVANGGAPSRARRRSGVSGRGCNRLLRCAACAAQKNLS